MQYQFGSCIVVPATREILLRDAPRVVPKKVFDFLRYLLAHRERVVSRAELLSNIWAGRVVTENVLARAAMLTRVAIDDTDPERPLIRTVVGIGYRFVGQVKEQGEDISISASAAHKSEGVELLRLGFLPFENESGDQKLAWVELGLLALVVKSLSEEKRLTIPTTSSVLVALESDAAKSEEQRVDRLRHVLELDVIMRVVVTGQSGRYALNYEGISATRANFMGRVQDSDLTRAASVLAKSILADIFPGTPIELGLEFPDPFLNECLARALQAVAERRFDFAEKALAIVHELRPSNAVVSTHLAYVQAKLGKPTAIGLATRLVADAERSSDLAFVCRAYYILALATFESSNDTLLAGKYAQRALDIAAPDADDEWYMRLLMLKFHLAYVEFDFLSCQKICGLGASACQSGKNRVALIGVLNNRAALEFAIDNKKAALQTHRECVDLARELNRPSQEGIALIGYAASLYSLGNLSEAIKAAHLYLERLETLPEIPSHPHFASVILPEIGYVLHRPKLIEAFTERLVKYLWLKDHPTTAACRLYADALRLRQEGRYDYADTNIVDAIDLLANDRRYIELSSLIPRQAISLAQRSRFGDAEDLLNRLTAFSEYPRDKKQLAIRMYLDGMQLWVLGQGARSKLLMCRAYESAHHGILRALIAFDLAWVHIDAGEFDAAAKLLQNSGNWTKEHPLGALVGARLAYEQGDPSQAVRMHRRHLQLVGGTLDSLFGNLGACYESRQPTGECLDLIGKNQLPSSYRSPSAHSALPLKDQQVAPYS